MIVVFFVDLTPFRMIKRIQRNSDVKGRNLRCTKGEVVNYNCFLMVLWMKTFTCEKTILTFLLPIKQRRLGCKQKPELRKMLEGELKQKLQLKKKGGESLREKQLEKHCSRLTEF